MNENDVRNIKKRKMYYARTYRYLKNSKRESILYLILLVLPAFVVLLLHYGEISSYVSELAAKALRVMLPDVSVQFMQVDFIPFLDTIRTVVVPTTYPSFAFTGANIGVTLLLLFLLLHGKGRCRPLPIFLSIILFIHLINCSFFLFAGSEFPYTAADYSGLYLQQQVGIWISFALMAGLVTGILGGKSILLRLSAFLGILSYSFVFGVLRYILALYVVYRFSVIYVALFFFALGPFFDFLYFVGIYGLFLDRMIKELSGELGMEEWKWS